MKLFLIKVGKAFHTLKREGLWRGSRRVIKSFFALFRRVGSGDILFITGGVGDSALYRSHHIAEELELQGLKTGITVQDNPLLPGYANKFSVFVFHRVLFTPSVAKLIQNIKSQKKEIIFETDDLVFDPQYLQHMDYFQKMNSLERKLYENGVGGEILDDPYVKTCTTTTAFLADKLRERGKQVLIVPNKLSLKDIEIIDSIVETKKSDGSAEDSDVVRIGYFSGTMSHNKDFATITDALMILLEKYPQMRLVLVGPLETESVLNAFRDRIEHLPFVPRDKHFANIASVDINLAPLEIGNPFCESKSELKFFEAGALGIPTVASATAPYREAIDDGIDGFVASKTDEWVDKLEKLIVDPMFRRDMGCRAREKVMRDYTNQYADNTPYYDFMRQRASNI